LIIGREVGIREEVKEDALSGRFGGVERLGYGSGASARSRSFIFDAVKGLKLFFGEGSSCFNLSFEAIDEGGGRESGDAGEEGVVGGGVFDAFEDFELLGREGLAASDLSEEAL